MLDRDGSVFIAGHRGLVGAALTRRLERAGFGRILTRTRGELDLKNERAVEAFFAESRPRYVFLAAAKVGGIHANRSLPADFIADNLRIQGNVLEAAHRHGVEKLLFLGSSCIYPKHAPQPMKEEHLLTGPLEPTNQPYAVAKIAGMVMCESFNRQHGTNFIAAMPTNLYGPGDNFDLQSSHVLPAMLRKFHEAKLQGKPEVELWGTGSPRREFLHVDDLADGCLFLMDHFDAQPDAYFMNVGTGTDLTIAELASTIADIVGFRGQIRWNTAMPDGTPRKLLDVSRLAALGWSARIPLRDGIQATYEWFLSATA
jgi:GDP-L-fucose synthase